MAEPILPAFFILEDCIIYTTSRMLLNECLSIRTRRKNVPKKQNSSLPT